MDKRVERTGDWTKHGERILLHAGGRTVEEFDGAGLSDADYAPVLDSIETGAYDQEVAREEMLAEMALMNHPIGETTMKAPAFVQYIQVRINDRPNGDKVWILIDPRNGLRVGSPEHRAIIKEEYGS